MFAYCGNNPISRADDGGEFWNVVIKAVIGVAAQYVSDVIDNIVDGKTGAEMFKPRSSVGEYVAAGVTAIIPGSGFGGAIVRNIVGEAITNFEKIVTNEEVDILESATNIVISSVFETGTEKISNFVSEKIRSLAPRNYSSHAGKKYKKNPGITKNEIYKSMRKTSRIVSAVDSVSSNMLDFVYGVFSP